MDLSQLEVFLTVARERRFSRAAVKLFRTQSAVSQSVRKLELEIGEPLFDRSSREGVLTDAGRVLQEYAEKLLNLRQDAQTALVEMRELQKGQLAIAANEFTALYLLPVLGEFRRLHPTIKITVRRMSPAPPSRRISQRHLALCRPSTPGSTTRSWWGSIPQVRLAARCRESRFQEVWRTSRGIRLAAPRSIN